MKILVTGGAGFLGRWIVKKLLDKNDEIIAYDNLSNGSIKNIEEFFGNENFKFVKGDVLDNASLDAAFEGCEICIHCAAQIEVQVSIDIPEKSFKNNIAGTYNILEQCRKRKIKLILIGTCMVYNLSEWKPINETHPTLPKSPYAGSKLAAEELAISYFHAYNLPVTILRPFNIYGPFQKSNMEGGVVNIFIKKALNGEELNVFGDGTQTRDLLYVEDCADFVVKAAFNEKANGEIINAGTGKDISINKLAQLITQDAKLIKHVQHHHPQSEIIKLVCDYSKAKKLLGWTPAIGIEEGIKKTTEWMKKNAY